jgi:hypothetical protein
MCLGWKFMFGCSLIYILSVCIALISALWAILIVDPSAIVLHMYKIILSLLLHVISISFFSQKKFVHIHKKENHFHFYKTNGDDDGI